MNGSPHYVEDIPVRPAPRPEPPVRPCMAAGCGEEGRFRAPSSPARLNDYIWFCLEHVRAYNRAWDFFRGMAQEEIEHYIRGNAVGHRPTFPLGVGGMRGFAGMRLGLADAFSLFDNGPQYSPLRGYVATRKRSESQIAALKVLDLDESASLQEATRRYKELVKRYHPDANGGDRRCEERLKRVIRAYRSLRAGNFR
jgi:hypothetical protein